MAIPNHLNQSLSDPLPLPYPPSSPSPLGGAVTVHFPSFSGPFPVAWLSKAGEDEVLGPGIAFGFFLTTTRLAKGYLVEGGAFLLVEDVLMLLIVDVLDDDIDEEGDDEHVNDDKGGSLLSM